MVGETEALIGLLVATAVVALVLLVASAAAFGRIFADLEYQYAAGLNGVRRIQSRVNLRTHGNRIMLALFALFTAVLALMDVTLIWRTWAGRLLFLLVLLVYAASSVLDWRAERRQVAILLRERGEARSQAQEDAP